MLRKLGECHRSVLVDTLGEGFVSFGVVFDDFRNFGEKGNYGLILMQIVGRKMFKLRLELIPHGINMIFTD